MANETTTTTFNDVVPTELIVALREYPRPTPVSVALAWIERGMGVVPINFPRFDTSALITAGTKTEAASFTRVAASTNVTAVTPAFVGSEFSVTDETVMSSTLGQRSILTIAGESMRDLANRIDTDLLATITGSTNTFGGSTTTMDRDALMQALGDYWALNLPTGGEHAIVLPNSGAEDLGRDTLGTSAVSAELQNRFGTSVVLGEFQGLVVLRGANCPTAGGADSGIITPVGNGRSGLLLGLSEQMNVRPVTRGSEGERDAEVYFVTRAMYGVADDDGFYLETQNAA